MTSTLIASPFIHGAPPRWASGYGQDEFGYFAEFSVATGDRYWDFVKQRMLWIPPGTFLMDSQKSNESYESENPQHEVTLSSGFWLANTACTQQLWEAVLLENPSQFKNPLHPVENISFDDVIAFIAALDEMVPGLQSFIPTEAQWEYACRAGTQTRYNFGDEINKDLVNYDAEGTVPCGSLPANSWGLYEMHGNVWEWCIDWYADYPGKPQIDSSNRVGTDRVIRGGSWYNGARFVRSTARDRVAPSGRNDNIGFRFLSSDATF